MAEGEGGSPGEEPGGAGDRGDRGGRGPLPLPGHCAVQVPPLPCEGRARPCPLREGQAAPEVSGRWRGPRADTPGRGRLCLSEGAWGEGQDVPPNPPRGRGLIPGPSGGSSRRALPESPRAVALPGAGRAACAAASGALVPESFCEAQVRSAELRECCCFAGRLSVTPFKLI